MAKGSQLTQLKSALTQAGLNRQPPVGKSNKKKRSQAGSREALDKVKRAQKLEAIKQRLNPFDVKVTKLKHDVGGRKLKGVTGRPQQSKQAGLDQRKKSLLKEYKMKDHAGGVIDRRIGENDPMMTPEERMLERFTKERQRASRSVAFNLEDEDELTHYGQSLSNLDDFEAAGLGLMDDDEDEDGKIDSQTVRHAHFGGFEDDDDDERDGGEERKKSKAEVMAEVIAKSKLHKFERQKERFQDNETRHKLDQELDDIRGLLFEDTLKDATSLKVLNQTEDKDYDQHVRELAMDRRTKPKDRTKTEEELALEEKEALEKAERKRLKRMVGEESDNSDDDERSGARKRAKRVAGGDDLDDDFHDEEEAEAEWGGLGAGLETGAREDAAVGGTGDDEDGSDEAAGQADDDSDSRSVEDNSGEDEAPVIVKKANFKGGQSKELPFTFPCPESHDEFLSLIENIQSEEVPVVIRRIRTLHHPSLNEQNKFRLQALTGVLIDYVLHVCSPPTPNFALLPPLIPHIHSLTQTYPIESAKDFVSKIKLMQKNLTRGLSRGASAPTSKTWPGTCELAFLWMTSYVWPTSDMNHHVISPTRILMGSYLGLCRIRSIRDIASGLFMCTLFLRYEADSKRFVPEVVAFLSNAVLDLCPHIFEDEDSVPGDFLRPDFNTASRKALRLSRQAARHLSPMQPNPANILSSVEGASEQDKMDLLGAAIDLIGRFADTYRSLEGSIELIQPSLDILNGLKQTLMSDKLKTKVAVTIDALGRLLKFANQARAPLRLQAHKPIPITTYIPKFQSSSSSYLRKNDPDHERAAASKLRYQYKQERKGAIRELRKDAQFLSGVKHKEQQEKDQAYKDRMNHVMNELEGERAEQKKMDREKLKVKKRAGRT